MVELSKSRVTKYMKCPAEYKRCYIDDEQEETEAMRRGKVIHEFIEKAYENGWFTVEWHDDEPKIRAHPSRVPQRMRKYEEYLKHFHQLEQERLERAVKQHGDDWDTFFFPTMQEEWLEIDIGNHRLRGYVDAVFPHEQVGRYRVVDYKTGYSSSKYYLPRTREAEVNIYALMLRRDRKHELEVTHGQFVHLMNHGVLNYDITSDSLKRAMAVVKEVGDRIEDREFECHCGGDWCEH